MGATQISQTPLDEIKDSGMASVQIDSNDIQNEILSVLEKDNLSSEQKAIEIASILLKVEQYSGPIPPPVFLEGYQVLIPNAPERFMQMVEEAQEISIEEQRANISLVKDLAEAQKTKVKNDHTANLLSQIFAFVLVILFIISGVYLTATGHDAIGGIIFSTTIIGVASLFITGALKKREQEQQEERELK